MLQRGGSDHEEGAGCSAHGSVSPGRRRLGHGPLGRPGDGHGSRGGLWSRGWALLEPGDRGGRATAIDETKAKEIATEYVTKNLPGYKVEKLVKFERPMGAMYQVELKGPKDEVRYLHINPWGYVMPFAAGRTL